LGGVRTSREREIAFEEKEKALRRLSLQTMNE
jgi:hypothetical protein